MLVGARMPGEIPVSLAETFRLPSFHFQLPMTKTYAQLAREIAALQASAQKQLALEAKGAIAKINDLISTYSLTAGDLTFASASALAVSRPASKQTKATNGKGGKASQGAKFSDGNGNRWGGRGPRPAWLRNAIAAGRALESFAIGAAPAPAQAPEPGASVAAPPANKAAEKSIASKRLKSAKSAKGKSRKAAIAGKPSPDAAVAGPALAAKTAVTTARKKAAAKKAVPARQKAGSPSAARKAAVANTPAPLAPEAAAAAVAP
jgi:DNA-binding protein H-NS